jgi:hypothetical protein
MGIPLKILWIAISLILVAGVFILSIWGIPIPKTEVRKSIPTEQFFKK